ncbi:MAG: right-handed parallel beta-helix repeat-containing protein, partial [Phycisphaerae bacterium]|nr:right-handed parallel beta-helix repeat-containing protein [Phycisphaerae bacterium]
MDSCKVLGMMLGFVAVLCVASPTLADPVWGDDFEDGVIDPALWEWGGMHRGFSGGGWQWSHDEIVASDGYLSTRVWGPTSGISYGAEAWVKTTYDYNDGLDYTINFEWEADVSAYHVDMYAIQITDGTIPAGTNIFWFGDGNGGNDGEGWKNLYFHSQQPDMVPEVWSVYIDGTNNTATLFQRPDCTGPVSGEGVKALSSDQPWHLRFIHSDATSAGFPGGDNLLNLYDFSSVPGHAQTIIYVDADATETPHDGSSWCHAYLTLYEALDLPPSPGTTIRVANGTYLPDPTGLGDPREATFQLINGVGIKGGYAGCGAPDPDERNILVHETILSGDIGTTGDDSDNSYNVVVSSNTDETAILDGFTITAGNADGEPGTGGVWYRQGRGGGVYNSNGNPTVLNCTFSANYATIGGGMFNGNGNPMVIDCTFSGNSAKDAGGMWNQDGSSPTVTNCTFIGNTASFSYNPAGGAMLNGSNSNPTITNCAFIGNTATNGTTWSYGGAIWNGSGSSPIIAHCTFIGNAADDYGGGIHNDNNPPSTNLTVTNCVFWGNTDGGGMDESAQIHDDSGCTSVVTYSCIQGCTAFCSNPDDHNIGDDPLFVTGPGGDFYLSQIAAGQGADSPCVDTGSDTAVNLGLGLCGRTTRTDEVPDTDIVDMGYHYPVDCNNNGIPDECDIAAGTSQDCQSNGIPDECELVDNDCNTNTVPDDCDIATGTSADCNSNGVPDECDPDCNTNGVPDECDIAAGTSEDCQPNGVPDECDIAGGTSQDCQSNGVPDECDVVLG